MDNFMWIVLFSVFGYCFSLNSTCLYKGLEYLEGDTILIDEPCLSCTCQKSALVCSLRVCPKLPDPPPKGCVIIQHKHNCCPLLQCDDTNFSKPNTTIGVHMKPSKRSCLINGTLYAEGSAMRSSSQCEFCYCIDGQQRCVQPGCAKPQENCLPILHEEHSCCPTKYNCSAAGGGSNLQRLRSAGCHVNGSWYEEGDVVASGNTCDTCFCNNDAIVCRPVRCTIQHIEGCYPIYAEDRCCPVAYNCSMARQLDERSLDTEELVTTLLTTLMTEDTTAVTEPTAPDVTEEVTVEDVADVTEQTTVVESYGVTTEDAVTTEFNTDIPITTTNTDSEIPSTNSADFTSEVPADNIITTSPEEYSIGIASKILLGGINRTQEEAEAIQRAQPLEIEDIILTNATRSSEDYDSYDYSEPKLPPSLPNLVIFPFVAADAVTKEKASTNQENIDKIDQLTSPVYYNNLFSPPVETEGGFVPKDDPLPEAVTTYIEGFYSETPYKANEELINVTPPSLTTPPTIKPENCSWEGKNFNNGETISAPEDCTSCVCSYGEVVCEEKLCPLPPEGCTADLNQKENGSCCARILCEEKIASAQEPLTTVQPVGITEFSPSTTELTSPITEEEDATPESTLKMDDLLPFILEQQTSRPVSVNYKNTVVSYYPKHQITTTREDDQKTTMVFAETPIIISSTELYKNSISTTETPVYSEKKNMTEFNTTKFPLIGIKEKVTKPPTPESFLDEFLKGFFENEGTSTTINPPKLHQKYSSKIRNPIVIPTTTEHSIDIIQTREGEEIKTDSFSLDSVLSMLFNSENSESTTIKVGNKTKHNNFKYTRKPIRRTKKPTTILFSTTEIPKINFTETEENVTLSPKFNSTHIETTAKSSYVTEEGTGFPKINILKQDKKNKKPIKTISGVEKQTEIHRNNLGGAQEPHNKIVGVEKQTESYRNNLGVEKHHESSRNNVRVEKQPESLRKPTLIPSDLGGILKLAGCNIYGRMYRIGKIIAELSNPCLKCMCTESGVQCSKTVC